MPRTATNARKTFQPGVLERFLVPPSCEACEAGFYDNKFTAVHGCEEICHRAPNKEKWDIDLDGLKAHLDSVYSDIGGGSSGGAAQEQLLITKRGYQPRGNHDQLKTKASDLESNAFQLGGFATVLLQAQVEELDNQGDQDSDRSKKYRAALAALVGEDKRPNFMR
eukprot:CAMPEP_0184326032 /NCGR_PEP_ID=MMETSP1049-20130417/142345_1 /TAXON_ID=77928 /ORGANISM="Proteomonas sulcata, Strain CCMP704" /LENGTH=165 /DNA_ID=CAMNT_0026648201 /DNA_START=761 /DNA_END=1259 /DNA_ORIENTATION=-